jgi:hypothetical protein
VASDASNAASNEELQARIEARLVIQEKDCKELGPVAESCRVAVYIVSYMSNSTSWKSAFVPLRLAEKLLNYLGRTVSTDTWRYRRDLFLWLLLVGASVGRGKNCFATELANGFQDLIARVTEDIRNWTDLRNGPKALQNLIKRFIYAEDWIAQRHLLPSWNGLERAVFLCGSEDVDIDVDTDTLLQELLPNANLFE